MRRGEYLEERMPDLRASVEEYFGEVTGTQAVGGHELFVVKSPDNPVFEKILVGAAAYEGKKDQLAVEFNERDPAELIAEGNVDAAEDAVEVKNEFLLEATGRDAKSRRESMKRDVEDDAPDAS